MGNLNLYVSHVKIHSDWEPHVQCAISGCQYHVQPHFIDSHMQPQSICDTFRLHLFLDTVIFSLNFAERRADSARESNATSIWLSHVQTYSIRQTYITSVWLSHVQTHSDRQSYAISIRLSHVQAHSIRQSCASSVRLIRIQTQCIRQACATLVWLGQALTHSVRKTTTTSFWFNRSLYSHVQSQFVWVVCKLYTVSDRMRYVLTQSVRQSNAASLWLRHVKTHFVTVALWRKYNFQWVFDDNMSVIQVYFRTAEKALRSPAPPPVLCRVWDSSGSFQPEAVSLVMSLKLALYCSVYKGQNCFHSMLLLGRVPYPKTQYFK
jgi:hypothetical protein